MTIKQYTAAGMTAAATIVMFAATPAMACNCKPAPKPAVHQHDVDHNKDVDHKNVDQHDVDHKDVDKKDCDHKKDVDHKKVVEQKHDNDKKDCDHKPVAQHQPAPKPKDNDHKDCDHKPKPHKPGKGGGTPSPTPTPLEPAVLSATTQAQPSSLPQTGANDLALLIGIPATAGAGAAYLRYKLRK